MPESSVTERIGTMLDRLAAPGLGSDAFERSSEPALAMFAELLSDGVDAHALRPRRGLDSRVIVLGVHRLCRSGRPHSIDRRAVYRVERLRAALAVGVQSGVRPLANPVLPALGVGSGPLPAARRSSRRQQGERYRVRPRIRAPRTIRRVVQERVRPVTIDDARRRPLMVTRTAARCAECG